MSPLGLEQLELFALELGKFAAFDSVYTLASWNINQSAPNFVKIYMAIRSCTSHLPAFNDTVKEGFLKHCGKMITCW